MNQFAFWSRVSGSWSYLEAALRRRRGHRGTFDAAVLPWPGCPTTRSQPPSTRGCPDTSRTRRGGPACAGPSTAWTICGSRRLPTLSLPRTSARMDRGHALDGAPGARGPSELPTLITATAEDLESISPLVRKTSLPSPRENDTLSFTLSLHRERTDLLQLVHGDLVDLRVELALPDLLARDAPVVLGHRRARLRGHLRS